MILTMRLNRDVEFNNSSKVSAIRELRGLTGMDLREAKEAVEVFQDASDRYLEFSLRNDLPKTEIERGAKALQEFIGNAVVQVEETKAFQMLRQAAKQAIDDNELVLATAICTILKEQV